MRIEDTPFHISGLEKFVELGQEQAFTGKATLARLAEDGVDRKLVGVDIGGSPMTDEGALNDFWRLRGSEGKPIGKVTAAAWSPRLERNVGFAWVPSSHMAVGTALEIDAPQGARPATVAALPFVDPKKDIPKG
jgi:aminomethyltransferase